MDQLPHGRPEGFSSNALFNDSQHPQYNAHDNLLHSNAADQFSYDGGWPVNAGNYGLSQSRAQAPQGWASQGNANHNLQGQIGNVSGHPSPYSRPVSQSPGLYGPYGYGAGQNFQYQQSRPQYDPALFQSSPGQGFQNNTANYQIPNAGTVAPQALQHDTRSPAALHAHSAQPTLSAYAQNAVDQQKLIGAIPPGADAGLFSIINFDTLSKATNTTRMGSYVNIGFEPMQWDCNRSTTLPPYLARRSRNELRRAAGNDSRLLDKIGKKSTKMQRIAAAPKSVHAANLASAHSGERIKYEGDPSSEEESSSDEDDQSSYTSDEEVESAPLPSKRPGGAVAGTEYDAIKAVWRSKRKGLSSDSIRKGLMDFWEIIKTTRDRWKADANAYEEAKKKNQKSQLPLLESRVKDQRDTIEVAFKAALKHGHRSIVEIMSENESLIYVCYQFLLDRVKAEDYNSTLPRTMLELMTIWTSLTEERIEKTHIGKVLVRYAKYGDAKTKYFTNKITSNAKIASKEAKEKAAGGHGKKNAAAGGKTTSPPQRHAEPVAGVKRAASTTAGDGTAAKKLATVSSKSNGVATSAKQSGGVKKSAVGSEAAKSSTSAPATVTKTKSVTAKPSGIFSSLSAAKKPGTSTLNKTAASGPTTANKLAEKKATTAAPKSTFSFAETMANLAKPKEEKPVQQKQEKQLPPETPEEKAKRLRKESRRHLRVSFKRDDELTEVRIFTHDPDEEVGHDASQMRDVSDVGGEGRMFKQQHQMMDVDEDDDAVEEEQQALVTFKEPGLIDFQDIDSEERGRNYSHRGGGKLEVDSPEHARREYYDANTLIVFYATPDEIPPNPREPNDPYTGDTVKGSGDFAPPEEKYAARARSKKAALVSQYSAQQQWPAQAPTAATQFDFSKLQGLIGHQQPPPNMQQQHHQPQPPQAAAAPDISSILASIQKGNTSMPTPPVPQLNNSFTPNFQPPPMMQPPPPQQHQQPAQITPDLAQLLAQLNNNQAPAMGYGAPQNYGQQQQQQQWGGAKGGNANNANRMTPETRSNPMTNSKYKTKVCVFWQKGTCQKGEECSYKHTND